MKWGYEGDIYLYIATHRQVESRRWGWLNGMILLSAESQLSLKFHGSWKLKESGYSNRQNLRSQSADGNNGTKTIGGNL